MRTRSHTEASRKSNLPARLALASPACTESLISLQRPRRRRQPGAARLDGSPCSAVALASQPPITDEPGPLSEGEETGEETLRSVELLEATDLAYPVEHDPGHLPHLNA
jgi:hypothetical protein